MLIEFNNEQNKKKPVTINKQDVICPFCHREMLAEIYEERGAFKWVKNKFQTFDDADMSLIIETEKCGSNLGYYSTEYATELLEYIIEKYEVMKNKAEYESVIMFKNYGFLSGGSIAHPHSQIVGFKKIDAYSEITKANLTGYLVLTDEIEINISKLPIANFMEYNFIFSKNQVKKLAYYLQKFIRNELENQTYKDYSYNLFLYQIEGKYCLKYTPRYPVSPYYIGFKIKQIFKEDELQHRAKMLRDFLLANSSEKI